MPKIHPLKLRLSNAFLILGDQPVLVDTGSAKDAPRIRTGLLEVGVTPSDLSLIIHTHVHSDHVGSTAELQAEANCPIAFHPADNPLAKRCDNGRLRGVGLRGRIMSKFFSHSKFNSVTSDISVYDGMSLREFGCDATVIETPGHTPGSVSIVTRAGDAIIGDVIMGGIMGGVLFSTRPNYHYFAIDFEQMKASVDKVVSVANGTLYVGHGGPLKASVVKQWRSKHQ